MKWNQLTWMMCDSQYGGIWSFYFVWESTTRCIHFGRNIKVNFPEYCSNIALLKIFEAFQSCICLFNNKAQYNSKIKDEKEFSSVFFWKFWYELYFAWMVIKNFRNVFWKVEKKLIMFSEIWLQSNKSWITIFRVKRKISGKRKHSKVSGCW